MIDPQTSHADRSLEGEIVEYVIQKRGAFPERVYDHFGRYREVEIKAAITSATERGSLVEHWMDDSALGGVRYSVLLSPTTSS